MTKRDQFCEGPPHLSSFMHSLLRWMENQLKDCQPSPQERQGCDRKDEDTHPSSGNGPT
jgi:hypothetical protein